MATMQRFLFDRRFDLPLADELLAAEAAVELPQPLYTEEDLARARAEGLAQGRSELQASEEARREAERRLQATAEAAVAEVARLFERTADDAAEAGRAAVLVAGSIARKLLPASCREHARPEIEAVVADALRRAPPAAPIGVFVAPALLAELRPVLEAAAAARGLAGRLAVSGDAALAEGDCRVAWPGGGVLRDLDSVWRDIDALITEAAGRPDGPPAPQSVTAGPADACPGKGEADHA